jgi:hypothetical protein
MGRRTQNNSRSHWYLAWSSAAITNNHNESQWPVRTNPCFEFTFFFKLNLIWIVYYLINIFKFKLRIAIWLKRKSVAGQLAQHSLLSVRSNGMAPRARSVRAKVSSSSWYLDFIMSDLQVDFVCFTWWSNTKSFQQSQTRSWYFSIDLFTQAAHMSVEIPVAEFQIGHGSGKFLRPEKVASVLRENKPGWTS